MNVKKIRSGLLGLLLMVTIPAWAQVPADSTLPPVQDTTTAVKKAPADTVVRVHKPRKKPDSLRVDTAAQLVHAPVTPPAPIVFTPDMLQRNKQSLAANSYFNFLGAGIYPTAIPHHANSSTDLFYVLLGMLFYFAFIKLAFGKYLSHLFTLYFRASMRQQQIREQMLQAPLPSLLLNILFVITGGMYAAILIQHHGLALQKGFWVLFLNCAAMLAAIYLVKFLVLKFSGWIFGIERATNTYIFIVFLANKILGILLLPVIVMLSFSSGLTLEILLTASAAIIVLFYIYRFFVSLGPVRKEIKVNAFHFFLYLCAFEVAPLFLIYKVLLTYLEKAY